MAATHVLCLIPYRDLDTDECEVFIALVDPVPSPSPTALRAQGLAALRQFADATDHAEIQDHCRLWQAARVLLPVPNEPTQWIGYRVEALLAGQLVQVS
jgi:hypothetical protein